MDKQETEYFALKALHQVEPPEPIWSGVCSSDQEAWDAYHASDFYDPDYRLYKEIPDPAKATPDQKECPNQKTVTEIYKGTVKSFEADAVIIELTIDQSKKDRAFPRDLLSGSGLDYEGAPVILTIATTAERDPDSDSDKWLEPPSEMPHIPTGEEFLKKISGTYEGEDES